MRKSYYLLTAAALFTSCFLFADDAKEAQTEEEIAFSKDTNPILSKDFTTPVRMPNEAPSIASDIAKKEKSAFIATSLAVIPGLGHVYLEDYVQAGELFGSAAAGYAVAAYASENPRFGRDIALSGAEALSTSISYSFYSAYRDVRNYRGVEQYTYQMPQDTFRQISFASFNPSILKKPEVWGGVLGSLGLATIVSMFAYKETASAHVACDQGGNTSLNPIFAFPTGISEETLFRGYLQSYYADATGSAIGGIAISSVLFGAAHIPNAFSLEKEQRRAYFTYSVPFITTLGAYFGYLTYKNKSLQEAVAVHSWYDFILFLGAYSVNKASVRGARPARISFQF